MEISINREILEKRIVDILHALVISASVALIAYITYDTLQNVSFMASPTYQKVQLWICLFFLFDILIECLLSVDKLRYLKHNILFILVSIPYLPIIWHLNLPVNGEIAYLLRFVPLVRAGYVLAIATGVMSKNWISSLFGIYIIILISVLYFLSLMFFVEEHFVNPGVPTYWSSLWYSVMQMTTCGCNIMPVTPSGKIIGVVLSAVGLILFPVFTVYFTQAFSKDKPDTSQHSS